MTAAVGMLQAAEVQEEAEEQRDALMARITQKRWAPVDQAC